MGQAAPTRTLAHPPSLVPSFARGALLSPLKRPRPDAGFTRTRLRLSGLRPDPARLAAYEQLCGFPSGTGELAVTYPHVLGFPLAMRLLSARDFPLPLLGLVHTRLDITRHRPLPLGETYELSVLVEELVPHRRGTEAVVVTEVHGEGGALLWESRSTYLARHRTAAGDSGGSGDAGRAPVPAPEAGEPLPVRAEWRLPGALGRQYAKVSGDRNPIHLHPLTARVFGFPRPLAHGMWTVARCLAAHGTPPAVRVEARFKAPVLLPSTVAYACDGTGAFELRGGERVHVRGRVEQPPSA